MRPMISDNITRAFLIVNSATAVPVMIHNTKSNTCNKAFVLLVNKG